jgi:hypothetical protein
MTALSIALATSLFKASPAGSTDALKIVEELEASWPDWLPNLDKCPADLMPVHESPFNFSIERCSTSMSQCIDHCRAGDANDCYATALVVQKIKSSPLSESLFLKACTLGLVSGCTNRPPAWIRAVEASAPFERIS